MTVGPPSSRSTRNEVSRLRFPAFNAIIVVRAHNPRQILSPAHSDPYLAPGASSEAKLAVVPDFVETFVPEVAPEPPQENGYRSLLPEDAIPNLQTTLASCGQLMISLR